jgi:hypothetical protein
VPRPARRGIVEHSGRPRLCSTMLLQASTTRSSTMFIRFHNRRTQLQLGVAESKRNGVDRFYSSIDECLRMANKCADKRNLDDANSWLDRGAQHLWGFYRPFGWR